MNIIGTEFVQNKNVKNKKKMFNACMNGNKELINELIDQGNYDWNDGLRGTCIGGHEEIAELMISKGADNLTDCICIACMYGHENIVVVLIEKGVTYLYYGFYNACYYGYLNIVKLLINNGVCDWNWGLTRACDGGNRDVVELMIKKGADDWSYLYGSAVGWHWKDLVVRSCYRVCHDIPNDQYDLVEIFNCTRKSNMSDIHVKLFDVNLFDLRIKTRKRKLSSK
jgi:ankyrin repeat protein